MSKTINAGRVTFVPKDNFSNNISYKKFDIVTYNGSSYFAKKDTIGHTPTEEEFWQLVAEKGQNGAPGAVKMQVVDTLPETGETDTIYLVKKDNPGEQNLYDEYVYTDTGWEHIGDTSVDLSNYYTKDEANEELAKKQDNLIAGENITIENNVISASGGNYTIFENYNEWDTSENRIAFFTEVVNVLKEGKRAIILPKYQNSQGNEVLVNNMYTSPDVSNIDLSTYTGAIRFRSQRFSSVGVAGIYSEVYNYSSAYFIVIRLTNGVVTNVSTPESYLYNAGTLPILSKSNDTPYTPTKDYHPSTKKYVDDSLKSFVPTPEVYMVVKENSLNPMTITDESTLETVSNAINQIKNNKGAIILFTFGSITRATYVGIIQPHNLTDTNVVIDLINSTDMYGNHYDIRVTGTTTNNVFTATKLQIMRWTSNLAGVGQVLTKTNTEKYTPTADYHPATKKYVDDQVGNINTVLATLTTVSEVTK